MSSERQLKRTGIRAAASERGIALVLVLLIKAILMVMAASLTVAGRIDTCKGQVARGSE